MAETEEDEYASPKNSVITSGVFIEPPPFRSVEEADEFLRNHEVATNNKFITELTRTFTTAGVASMKYPKLRWTYPYADCDYFDGIPFAIIGIKKFGCQYGSGYNEKRRMANKRATEKRRRLKGITGNRTRSVAPSKKVNCPAKAKMTLIVKFPDYAIPENTRSKRNVMGSKMKREFSDDTQRYVLVYLRIFHQHEHGALALQLNNIPSKITSAHVQSTSAIVLKQCATLRGKSLSGLIPQFACCTEIPECLAQPSTSQRLENMQMEELLAFYWDLTGDTPNNVFIDTQREFNEESLRLLLHLSIIFANAESEADGRIVAHRSIRIAGTENDFEPILCCRSNCILEDPHMHCPLCTPNTAYINPVKLKNHFQKKHIKVALDYAGLKILRCRDECVVKGVIKDIKAYTRGHWHCWKCDMGYEKRDTPTFKHFQSHLMGSQTGSVLVTESVFPSTNPFTIMFNVNPSKTKPFTATKVPTTPRNNYSAPPITHTHNYSDNEDKEDDPEVYVPTTSTSPSRPHVGSEFMYTSTTGEEIPQEYEQAILYIEEGDEQVVYTQALTEPGQEQVVYTQANEKTDEVVIQIPEHDEKAYLPFMHLREKVAELQQRCMQLERHNIAQQSEILFLNEKIATLESKQYTCSNCSIAMTPDKHVLVESLNDLHCLYEKKNKDKSNTGDIAVDLTEGLLDLKKDIESLKRVSGIRNQIHQNGTPFLDQSTAEAANETIQPFYLGADVRALQYAGTQFEANLNADVNVDYDENADIESDTDGSISELDYKAFGKSGNIKRGRRGRKRIVVLPLPDNAVDMVEKCNKLISEQQSQQTVYDKNKVKPIVTKICRVWQADINEKLTQTDFDEEFQINYDTNNRLPSLVLTESANKDQVTVTEDVSNNSQKRISLNQYTENIPVSCVTTLNAVNSVTLNPSVQKGKNSNCQGSVFVKSARIKPSSVERLHNVGSVPLNSVITESNVTEVLKTDDPSPVKDVGPHPVKYIPTVVKKLNTTQSNSSNQTASASNVAKLSKSDSTIPVKTVSFKLSVKEKLNSSSSVSGKSILSKSNEDNSSISDSTSQVEPVEIINLESETSDQLKSDRTVLGKAGPGKAVPQKAGPGKAVPFKLSVETSSIESEPSSKMKSDINSAVKPVEVKHFLVKPSVVTRSINGEKSNSSNFNVNKLSPSIMQTRGALKKRHTESQTKKVDKDVTGAKKKRLT